MSDFLRKAEERANWFPKDNFMGFPHDSSAVFHFIIDESGSMDGNEKDVLDGLKDYKANFLNDFPNPEMVAVSVSKFSNDYFPKTFTRLQQMKYDYRPDGATTLYHAIVQGTIQLIHYINQIQDNLHISPRCTFILFSDGESCQDKDDETNAKEAIKALNDYGVTTVFVAFGQAIMAEFGKRLGFQSTIDVNDKNDIRDFMGGTLVEASKTQSQSAAPLGSNFFSASLNSSSAGYTLGEQQALGDTLDFLDDI